MKEIFKRKKRIIILSAMIFVFMILIIGSSYAFFNYNKDVVLANLKTGNIRIDFNNDVSNFNILNATPTSDIDGKASTTYLDFSVTGTVDMEPIFYEIDIVPKEGNTLNSNYIKVYLTDQSNNVITDAKRYTALDSSTKNSGNVLVKDSFTVTNGESTTVTRNYRLRMWLDENYFTQTEETFEFEIKLYAQNEDFETVEPVSAQKVLTATSDRLGNITLTVANSDGSPIGDVSSIEYSSDNTTWQASNAFQVSDSGTYPVYAKVTKTDSSVETLTTNVVVNIQYQVNYMYGIKTMYTEYVNKGGNISYRDTGSSSDLNSLYSSAPDYGYYSDFMSYDVFCYTSPKLTSFYDLNQTINADTNIYCVMKTPWVIPSSCNSSIPLCNDQSLIFGIEKSSTINTAGLTFVSSTNPDVQYYNQVIFQKGLDDGIDYPGYTTEPGLGIVYSSVDNNPNVDFNVTYRDANGNLIVVKYELAGCLFEDTEILIEEEDDKKKKKRKKKKIKDITYDDNLVVWDFDKGCETTAKPLWIMNQHEAEEYCEATFDDGTKLISVNAHRIFNLDLNKFTYLSDKENTPIGTRVYKEDGSIAKIIDRKMIRKKIKYNNIVTEYHLNLFANGILTSCRLNNMYEIKDMKFVKDNRKLRDRSEFEGIDDKYIDGFRLLEQPNEDINRMNAIYHGADLKEYVITNFLKNMKDRK